MNSKARVKTVFISHSSKDSAIAMELCALLEARGLGCWIAPRDLWAGRDYGMELIHGIESTDATLLVLSQNANASTFVKMEIERAVSKGKPVFPVRTEEVLASPGLEFFISSTHWLDLWSASREVIADQLAHSINQLMDKPVAPRPPTPPPAPPSLASNGPNRNAGTRTGLILGVVALVLGAAVWWMVGAPAAPAPATTTAQPPSVATLTAPAREAPAPVASAPPLPPVASAPLAAPQRPMKPAAPSVVNRPATAAGASEACARLLEKAGSGEPLSAQEQNKMGALCK